MRLVIVLLLALPVSLVAQEKKGSQHAFLVGCSGYPKAQLSELPFAVKDIERFRQALLETGFEDDHIKILHDHRERRYQSEKAKIDQEFDLFLAGLKPEDTVVVALSGHGVMLKKETTSYFCPLDTKLDDKKTLIPLDGKDGLLEKLKNCKANRKLLIVSACRNVTDIGVDVTQAATKVDLDGFSAKVPEGIAALYSCEAGQKSYYDPKRGGSIFFEHVTRAWIGDYAKDQPHTPIEDFFREVGTRTKVEVDKLYTSSQVPEVSRNYKGEWNLPASRIGLDYRDYEALLKKSGSSGKWFENNGPKRYAEWRRLADAGHVPAMLLTGRCLETGAGTNRDLKEAVGWFGKAAKLGHPTAAYCLAYCHEDGLGVEKNEKEAITWYRKAAELGHTGAMTFLGKCHANGVFLEKDEKQAVEWYRKAAELGDAPAMTLFGSRCEIGKGITKNEKEAVEWYHKAAKLGYDKAILHLGTCYELGIGVGKDIKEAMSWYDKAAKLGDKEAEEALERLGKK